MMRFMEGGLRLLNLVGIVKLHRTDSDILGLS